MKRDQKTYWAALAAAANVINAKLKRKPRRFKLGYQLSPGGILNAFREGDLTFKQAVRAIELLIRRSK